MLNDILDLCIEKSKDGVFYSLHWSSVDECLVIGKVVGNDFNFKKYDESELENALEFMENE